MFYDVNWSITIEWKLIVFCSPHCKMANQQSCGPSFQLVPLAGAHQSLVQHGVHVEAAGLGCPGWMCILSQHLAMAIYLYLLIVLIWKPLRVVFMTDELNMFLLVFREPQGIIACCNPVPPLVRQQINEMHLLIQQAREMPLLKVRSFPAEGRLVLSVSILLPYSL